MSNDFWSSMACAFAERGFAPLPNTYLVLDIETTHVVPSNGEILQIGYLFCRDGKPVVNNSIFLRHSDAVLDAYDNSNYVQTKKKDGNEGFVKVADVRAYGVEPHAALSKLADITRDVFNADSATPIVGHNVIRFDTAWLEHHAAARKISFRVPRDRVIDTGALVKACKMRKLPMQQEPLAEFALRIHSYIAKGVFWNLALSHSEYSNAPMDTVGAHDAAFDCLMTHNVWQGMRRLMGAA